MENNETENNERQSYIVSYFPQGSPQKDFMVDLKNIFLRYKKCQGLTVMLTECYEKSRDPFFASLSIAYNSFDYSNSKITSLTYTVLEVFSVWILTRMDTYGHLLTDNNKKNAFKVASGQKNRSVSQLIVNTYQLKESNESFVDDIKEIIVKHHYKEACELVKMLNLDDKFTIYDFLVPLFLQDKINLIDEFLIDNTDYQITFLSFLDGLIIEPNLSSRISKLISDLNLPDIPINILCKLYNVRSLNRYIKRLLAQFNIPKTQAPNFAKRSVHKAMSHFIHKRFIEKALTDELFREQVNDIVMENEEATHEFLTKLFQVGAYSEVLHWCEHLNLTLADMPQQIQQLYESKLRGEEPLTEQSEEEWVDLNEEFHTLFLPISSIVFVSTEAQLLSILELEVLGAPQLSKPNSIQLPEISSNDSLDKYNDKPSLDCKLDDSKVQPCSGHISDKSCKSVEESNEILKQFNNNSDAPISQINSPGDGLPEKSGVTSDDQTIVKAPSINPSNETSVDKCPILNNSDAVAAAGTVASRSNNSLLVSGGASLISGAASLVSGGASIVQGGVSLLSGTASLVCSGASVVSGGASLVSTGVSLVSGRSSLISAGASLVSGGASIVSGGSSLVSTGVSLVSGTASMVSGSVALVSGSASLVSGAASLVAGGVSKVANQSQSIEPPSVDNLIKSQPNLDPTLLGPGGAQIVALDCEWKPKISKSEVDLSLLQLATPSSVYILDMISLTTCHHHWDQLISNIFNNQDVLKLGFSMNTDMMYLSMYFNCDYTNFGCNLLDLADLWSKLMTDYNLKFPYSDDSQGNGMSLSRLVYLCLGKNLDKKERLSNWELRPLRDTQIHYAALDSYCLIEVYNVIKQLCLENGLPFDDIVSEVVHKYEEKLIKKKKKSEDVSNTQEKTVKVLNENPIGVDDLSLICDKAVTGLAKKLRRCGISADTINPSCTPSDIVRKVLTENKTLLVKGPLHNKMKESIPQNQVYRIKSWNLDTQLIEVLNYFNFVVRKEDVFSRCLECNSICMLKCSKEDVMMWHRNPYSDTSPQIYTSVPAGYEDDELDEDDYFFDDDYDAPDDDYYSPPVVQSSEKPKYKPVSTRYGCPIKTDVPESVIGRVNAFYLCESCGKIYWNEGQFDQILGTLNDSFS